MRGGHAGCAGQARRVLGAGAQGARACATVRTKQPGRHSGLSEAAPWARR